MDPGPESPQQSPLHSRSQPVTPQSPPRILNPPLLRHPLLGRKLDPGPHPPRDPQPELARPRRLDLSRERSARPHSRLSRGNAQPVRCNSDAPWTRFIVQGPFGPRATGLGTGEAAGIWKTPTAYIGRRQGVSGPELAAFIPELEEGKPGPGTPERGGLEQLQAGGAPVRSRRPAPT